MKWHFRKIIKVSSTEFLLKNKGCRSFPSKQTRLINYYYYVFQRISVQVFFQFLLIVRENKRRTEMINNNPRGSDWTTAITVMYHILFSRRICTSLSLRRHTSLLYCFPPHTNIRTTVSTNEAQAFNNSALKWFLFLAFRHSKINPSQTYEHALSIIHFDSLGRIKQLAKGISCEIGKLWRHSFLPPFRNRPSTTWFTSHCGSCLAKANAAADVTTAALWREECNPFSLSPISSPELELLHKSLLSDVYHISSLQRYTLPEDSISTPLNLLCPPSFFFLHGLSTKTQRTPSTMQQQHVANWMSSSPSDSQLDWRAELLRQRKKKRRDPTSKKCNSGSSFSRREYSAFMHVGRKRRSREKEREREKYKGLFLIEQERPDHDLER